MTVLKPNNTSIKDMLFIIIIGLAALFAMAFLLINPPTKKNDIPKKAEYIMVVEWDDYSDDDIDIWVRGPDGKTLSYKQKEVNTMFLEKDDLGAKNDAVTDSDGKKQFVPTNREVVTIRGVEPGTFNVALHIYKYTYRLLSKTRYAYVDTTQEELEASKHVTFTLIKVNPSYQEVFKKRIHYSVQGEEIHIVNFEMLDDGSVRDINQSKISFIYKEKYKQSSEEQFSRGNAQ